MKNPQKPTGYDKNKAWIEVLQRKKNRPAPKQAEHLLFRDYTWCSKVPLTELNTPSDVLTLLGQDAIPRPFGPWDVLNVVFPAGDDLLTTTYVLLPHDHPDPGAFLWTDGKITVRPEPTPYGLLVACRIHMRSKWSRLPNT